MIDANNGEEWTPPTAPNGVDDWCTSDQMFDARNKIEAFGKLHPGNDVSLTVKFRSGSKTLVKTAESIQYGDNWLTIDGTLRHRFSHADAQAETVAGWGDDATWGEKRNFAPTGRQSGVVLV